MLATPRWDAVEDEAMSERPTPDVCTHPAKGVQERILGAGTGDYHCRECGDAMPVGKPAQCISCGSTTAEFAPEPTHGMTWRCAECGKTWAWVS